MRRRTFLLGTAAARGGGLVIGYGAWRGKLDRQAKAAVAAPGTTLLANWVKISSDGTITLLVPHADMGQGAFTALAMVLAEELDADWSQMRAERAPAEIAFANGFLTQGFILGTRPLPPVADDLARAGSAEAARLRNVQVTGGSMSVRMTGEMGLRVVGAAARAMLVEAASRRWNVPIVEVEAARSVVKHNPSGRTATYAELAQAAAEISPPAHPRLKTHAEYHLIGSSPPRFDIPAKSTGRQTYGIDLQMPGMKVATVMAAPVTGGTLIEVDPAPALALGGVERVVKLSDAVAVVGTGYWYARRGLLALFPRWSDGGNGAVTSETIARQNLAALAGSEGKALHKEGDMRRAGQGRAIEATYEVPLLYHAAMEPINVTAQWVNDKLTVWCGEQDALGAKANVLDGERLVIQPGRIHRHADRRRVRPPLATALGSLPPGRVESFGSVVAEVVEASFDKDNTPRVHRVVAVVDCGAVVHRDTATQQVEGGIVMGLSAALGEAITIDKGAVAQRTLHDYRLLKLADVPRIEVHFIEDESISWGGIGEVGVPPAAPALANALAAAGKRVRRLPVIA